MPTTKTMVFYTIKAMYHHSKYYYYLVDIKCIILLYYSFITDILYLLKLLFIYLSSSWLYHVGCYSYLYCAFVCLCKSNCGLALDHWAFPVAGPRRASSTPPTSAVRMVTSKSGTCWKLSHSNSRTAGAHFRLTLIRIMRTDCHPNRRHRLLTSHS